MAGQLVHNINVVSLGFKIESLGSIVKSGDAINTDAEEKYIIKDNMSDDETKDGVSDDDSKSNNEGDFNNFFESSAVEVDTTKQAWDDAVSKIKKAQIDAIVKQPGETDAGYINRVIWEIKHPVRIEDEGLHKRICEMDKQSLREAEKELRKLILQDLEQEAQMEAELAAVRVKKSDSKLVHNDKANTNCDKKDLDNNDIESIDNKIQLTEEIESSKQSQSSKESDATKGACCKGVKFTEHIEFISNMSANDFAITNKEVNTNDFNNFNNSNNIGQTNENIKLSEDLKPEIDELKSVETTYKSELIGKVKSECAGKAKEMGHPKIIKERHLWCVKYLNVCQAPSLPSQCQALAS